MDTTGQIEMLRKAVEIAGLSPREVVLPEDRQVIVGSMRFHYLDWGGSGHPILLLHGGGLNAHTWDVVCLMLRDRYRCVALDQRGHGDSEWSPANDYGVETQVVDVEGFVDSLNLANPVLVGQSMGGLNSMAYAVRWTAYAKAIFTASHVGRNRASDSRTPRRMPRPRTTSDASPRTPVPRRRPYSVTDHIRGRSRGYFCVARAALIPPASSSAGPLPQ